MYMVAGAAAIPAGILYAMLAVNGWERWWADLVILTGAVLMAHLAWRRIERRSQHAGSPSTNESRPIAHFRT
jgi:membrane protein implicated in regulation of membrane protease activity